MSKKKILILSSGGDAPGMNAAIRACVRTALHHDFEIFGCEHGFQGLMDQQIRPLHADSVANIIQRGGTALKTARCPEFTRPEAQSQAREFLLKNHFTGIVVLGGNGSFQGAAKLAESTLLQVIGIPCTIDNDIIGTDYCIGFDTACNTALKAIDNIRDTALSHDRNFIIEVMGRASGFLAVEVGIAGGAEFILIPELPITTEQLIDKIQHKKREKITSIIVVAEANQPGHSMQLAENIKNISGLHYRTCILGHTQRGGSPTVRDRKTATLMGIKAVEALIEGRSNTMVAESQGELALVDLPDADNATRLHTQAQLLKLNQIVCGID